MPDILFTYLLIYLFICLFIYLLIHAFINLRIFDPFICIYLNYLSSFTFNPRILHD